MRSAALHKIASNWYTVMTRSLNVNDLAMRSVTEQRGQRLAAQGPIDVSCPFHQ